MGLRGRLGGSKPLFCWGDCLLPLKLDAARSRAFALWKFSSVSDLATGRATRQFPCHFPDKTERRYTSSHVASSYDLARLSDRLDESRLCASGMAVRFASVQRYRSSCASNLQVSRAWGGTSKAPSGRCIVLRGLRWRFPQSDSPHRIISVCQRPIARRLRRLPIPTMESRSEERRVGKECRL